MKLMIALLLVVGLVLVFRKVRADRALRDLEPRPKIVKPVVKRQTDRSVSLPTEVEAWMRMNTRDVRPDRGRHIEDAPNYTSYNTEATGKFKIR